YKGGVIMDFSLNKEQLMIKQTFRDVAEKEILSIVDEYEENEEFPEFLFPKLGELGYLGMTLPTEYGGMGADTITFCLFAEEFGKVNSGITSGFVVHSSVPVSAILQGGSEEQKKKYLSKAVSGESIFAIGITEPNVGSDVANIKTEAKSAENNYILNGSKVWITNGGIADYVVVAAREDGVSNLEGVQLFLVPTDTPGFQVANRMKKHGIQTSDTSELVFDNCKRSEEHTSELQSRFDLVCRLLLEKKKKKKKNKVKTSMRTIAERGSVWSSGSRELICRDLDCQDGTIEAADSI